MADSSGDWKSRAEAVSSGDWKSRADVIPEPEQSTLSKVGHWAVDQLPVAGSIAGGLLGTPLDLVAGPAGNIAGAGLGGAIGSAAKDTINNYLNPPDKQTSLGQGAINAVEQGTLGAVGEGAGQVAAPYIAKAASVVSKPVSDWLAGQAEKQAVRATGASGATVYNKFPENAGRELLDSGIVGFGDTQKTIAKKATEALTEAKGGINASLDSLDRQGASLSQGTIVENLRNRATELAKDPASLDIADGLNRLADRLDSGVLDSSEVEAANSADYPNQSLRDAEDTKRVFDDRVNYNNPGPDSSISKEAANIYRSSVEDAATRADPTLAGRFEDSKKLYGTLAPIQEAAAKKAAQEDQLQGINLHSVGLNTIAAGAGALSGGPVGGVLGYIGSKVVAPRISSSAAIGADWLANVVRSNPHVLGQYASVLTQAAARGATSLAASDYVLQQTDPAYREKLAALHSNGGQ